MDDQYRKFYESVAEKYPEDSIVYRTLSGYLRKKWIMNKLRDFPQGSLLDCGCNVGTLSRNWQKGIVFGVDIAHAVLKKGKALSPQTNFVQADLCDMRMFKTESVDSAMVCEVVEHLVTADRFFENLYRTMKKGGLVLVTSPNFTSSRPHRIPLGILRSFGVNQGTEGKHYLHTAYKPAELAAMAQRAGYTVLEQGSFEIELRGWLKPITILRQFLNKVSMHLAPASRMPQLLEHGFNRIELNIFYALDTFNFGLLLRKIFSEGRRSYIVAKK
ncbi:MAG: class I SAM-dependent methyltransferase [candidate division WOR-3 bacterium]|nr:class I SAM-dependent methyltransferase [candidate division WOR-3 bacterium]